MRRAPRCPLPPCSGGAGGGRRALKLVHDGHWHKEVVAFEDEPIPTLKEPIVGAVLLLRDVKVRRGLLLLQLDGVRVVS